MASDILGKKCGEILINIKKNKKSKTYTFSCLFCKINCDQLKKFTQHLTIHIPEICEPSKEQNLVENQDTSIIDIKEEQNLVEVQDSSIIDIKEDDDKDNVELLLASEIKVELPEIQQSSTEYNGVDPLETGIRTKLNVKTSSHDDSDDEEDDDYDFNCDLEYEDSVEYSESDEEDNTLSEVKSETTVC